MSVRVLFAGVVGLAFLTLVVLFITQDYSSESEFEDEPKSVTTIPSTEIQTTTQSPQTETTTLMNHVSPSFAEEVTSTTQPQGDKETKLDTPCSAPPENVPRKSSDKLLQQVIDQQREKIRRDMKNYEYPNGKYNISASKLEDLVMEENGQPIRSVIVTTWRSGSTFLSDVMNTHPLTFFHQEPLLDFDIVQIRGPPLAAEALKSLRSLLKCDYSDADHYLEFSQKDTWALSYNKDYWRKCRTHKRLCFNKEFLSGMCKLFPFQLTKLVRITLGVVQELLADEDLPLRMVYLVRDPRGTLQSRKHREWCPGVRDCFDPGLLCADLAADYKVAVELQKKYPTTFRVIRYEDLAADPYGRVEELSNFFGIGFDPQMKKFLDTHTKTNHGDVSSTYRDTKQAPYHWKTELEFNEVDEIQRSCIDAMESWGYLPAINATHQLEFHPVTNYTMN